MLLDYDVWTFIRNKKMMYISSIVLLSVIISFVIIPQEILSPDMIAFTGAAILLLISSAETKDIFKKLDFKLILYLMGIFIVTGGLESVGVVTFLGALISNVAPSDAFLLFIMVLWVSAFSSAVIDNIPVTRILLPTIDVLMPGNFKGEKVSVYSGMVYGVNWGDNLVPVGDIILVLQVAEKQKVHLKPINYFKIAFPITIIQLCLVSIIFALIMRPIVGIILMIVAVGTGFLIFGFVRWRNTKLPQENLNRNENLIKKNFRGSQKN